MNEEKSGEKPEEKHEEKKEDVALWTPLSVLRDMDKMFDKMFSTMRKEFERMFWTPTLPSLTKLLPTDIRMPHTDIIDAGERYKVVAEVPGVPKENIEINVTSEDIEISAEKAKELKEAEGGYVKQERSYSRFYRKLAFPTEVLPDRANASLKDGVLEITIPKKPPIPEKRHRVAIK